MTEILVIEREIVVPGQVLASGLDYLPSGASFREKDKIISSHIGLISIKGKVIKVTPLSGKYFPKPGDLVIGKIKDMSFSNWYVDVGYAYEAALSIRDVHEFIEKSADLSRYYNFNDVIAAKVTKVTRSTIDITMKEPGLQKLNGGRIIEITPNKVPRVIGRQGSMIDMIKTNTNCKIIVGQNGRIWIKGNDFKNELLAVNAILKIENESHIEGLTDKIKEFLEQK